MLLRLGSISSVGRLVPCVLAVALSLPGLAAAQRVVVRGGGDVYHVDLALAKRRFSRELEWLRSGTPLDGKLALERVEGGLRVSGVSDDERYADFGLRDNDVLCTVNGKRVARREDLLSVLEKSSARGRWDVHVKRDGRSLELVYLAANKASRTSTIGGLVGTDDSWGTGPPRPPSSDPADDPGDEEPNLGGFADRPPPPEISDATLFASVRRVDHDTWSIDRHVLQGVLRLDPGRLLSKARIEPVSNEGETSGFLIKEIEPAALLARVGLERGDEIRSINGISATMPDELKSLYRSASVGPSTTLRCKIQRRGRSTTIVWVIRDGT